MALVFHNCSGNEFLHDFIGPSIDRLDTSINIGPRDAILPHVAPSTMKLKAVVGHFVLKVCAPVTI